MSVEIEALFTGQCVSHYSGRCTLSTHMSMRDANRGGVALQSCRWKYGYLICLLGQGKGWTKPAKDEEEFSMSARVYGVSIEHIS